MNNFYILTGPSYYDIDIILADLKADLEADEINYFRTYNSMKESEVSAILSDVLVTIDSNSDSGFGDDFFIDDIDETDDKTHITILETSDSSCILKCINNKHLLSQTNILVLVCPIKPSDKALKAIQSIDDDFTKVIHLDHINNSRDFNNFCLEIIEDIGLNLKDNKTKDHLLEFLEHECSFSQKSNWEIEFIELNSNYKSIVYDKGCVFNILMSLHSYSKEISLKELKEFYSLGSRSNKRELLIKLLSQKNSFHATEVLFEEFDNLDLTDLKSFLGYFCYCLEEYVKSMKKERYNHTSASPFMNKKNFKIIKPIQMLQNLTAIRQNYYFSKESILTSFSLELHKSSM